MANARPTDGKIDIIDVSVCVCVPCVRAPCAVHVSKMLPHHQNRRSFPTGSFKYWVCRFRECTCVCVSVSGVHA